MRCNWLMLPNPGYRIGKNNVAAAISLDWFEAFFNSFFYALNFPCHAMINYNSAYIIFNII
jgi:hypothetical protein